MDNSTIAFGGVLKTRADEERLVDILVKLNLPANLDGEFDHMPDEPVDDDAEWWDEQVDDTIAQSRPLCLTTWEPQDEILENAGDLLALLKELGFTWRIFQGSLAGVRGSRLMDGAAIPCFTLHTPDGPEAGITALVDEEGYPLMRVPVPPKDQRLMPDALLGPAEQAMHVVGFQLPPLSRAYDPE